MSALGWAVHNCIAFCLATNIDTSAEALASILARWCVGAAVDPDTVLAQAQAFVQWVEGKWPCARLWTEVPLEVRLASSQFVRGQVDLLAEVEAGWLLVDHKSDPRSAADGNRLAEAQGGQLEAYAQAVLEATGRPVLERWLFLPISWQAVRVVAAAAPATEEQAAAS